MPYLVLKRQAMIRPRIGSFVYTEDEIQTMEEEILALHEAGATGFVFGCLTTKGAVDVPAMRR
jgi:copper homeostasis protein